MKSVVTDITGLIGGTPIARLDAFSEQMKLCGPIFAKLEYFNPAGSIKDRTAYYIIKDAEKSGLLKKGSTIIEPTSGNTGIGLACVAAARGYRVILTMPDTMSKERINMIEAYGASVVLTPGEAGMSGSIEKAEELNASIPDSMIAGQFVNPSNVKAHYETTAPEIWEQMNGEIDIFVSGVGTGGTLTGCAKYLKEKNPKIEIVAVEPFDSPLLSEGRFGSHGLQGIGANFVPEILDRSLIDRIITVKTEQAYSLCRSLAHSEGYLVGITSGAALFAACELAKEKGCTGKRILALLPDGGDRYMSLGIYK